MTKTVAAMTDEERAKLFPVILTKHTPEWKNWYEEEKINILSNVNDVASIHHYGSSSIPNILSKPTIDILIEVEADVDLEGMKNTFIQLGYDYMKYGKAPSMLFVKGYTVEGFAEKVFHVHVIYKEDYQPEILFRDYLISHPNMAKEYEELKIELKNQLEFDRDAYTNGKTEFIKRISNIAVEEYKIRDTIINGV